MVDEFMPKYTPAKKMGTLEYCRYIYKKVFKSLV